MCVIVENLLSDSGWGWRVLIDRDIIGRSYVGEMALLQRSVPSHRVYMDAPYQRGWSTAAAATTVCCTGAAAPCNKTNSDMRRTHDDSRVYHTYVDKCIKILINTTHKFPGMNTKT